jgi:hypothetical protein
MLPSLPPLPSASGASRTGRTVAPASAEPPRLSVNLSPDAATRLLSGLGLGVALCATVATTTALVAGMGTATPQALLALTGWLVSLPWLFVSVVLLACARIERLVRPADAAAWTSLAVVALGAAALQVVGRELVSGPALAARAGLLIVAAAAVSVFFRQFFRGAPRVVRQQLSAGVFGGLFVGLGPFTLLGATLLPATDHTASLDALLVGSDALVALVLGTFAVHAALVYVRDFLPDFNIALETNADSDARRVSAAR